MRLIYWSHSYRPEDRSVNGFFSRLFALEGLSVTFDPPSDRVNGAKLQRHLNGSDAMVSVVTMREDGVSPYILFEIELCVRARKPLLVFLEDVVPDGLIPSRPLQRRFSRGGYVRQVREHRHALQLLKTYLGDEPPPRYQPDVAQRSCALVGDDVLDSDGRASLARLLADRGYRVIATSGLAPTGTDVLVESQVALAFIDSRTPRSQYALGLLQAASVPTVEFTFDAGFAYHRDVPIELQPCSVATPDWATIAPAVEDHLSLTEENFVEGETAEQLEAYLDVLFNLGEHGGAYRHADRERVERVVKYVMGDEYTIGQAGAVGPGAHAEHMTFVQSWNALSGELEMAGLADELATLRRHLREHATEPEQDAAIGALAEAEMAAREGDGPRVLEHISILKRLGGAGKWALGAATTVGTTVAAAALNAGLGV